MFSRALALAAVFAVAHAGLQASNPDHESPEDHPSYSPQSNGHDYHPMNNGEHPKDNGKHDLPEALAKHLPLHNSSFSAPSSSTTGSAPYSSSTPYTTTAPSSGFSSRPSSGYPSFTNSSSVPVTLGPSYTTKIITETITDCPVTVTKGHGAEATTSVYYTTSTKTITSTITVCTKCVEAPKTHAASPSPGVSPQETQPEDSPEQPSSHTLTYTVGSGESTSVVTTTVKNTKTKTNTHTVYAPSDSPGASPESDNKCHEGEECITQTSKIYKTSTLYITAAETCPPQVTVTVPGPDVTVTVTSMEGPPPSFTPPYPSSRSNSTIPGTSTSAPSSGFLTIPHPTYNPSPSSDLFPKVSAVAQAHAEANADASGGQDDDDDDELA